MGCSTKYTDNRCFPHCRNQRHQHHSCQYQSAPINRNRCRTSQFTTQLGTTLLVLVLACVVHVTLARTHVFAAQTPATVPPTAVDSKNNALPKNVAEMRDALLAATLSGAIDDLITPYQWNELPPGIADDAIDDPIAYWKRISSDGEGIEILAILSELLRLPPAKLHVGPDFENSALYVWPYLAEHDLGNLTPAQKVELRTLVPAAVAKDILSTKKWSWWRLSIGADGTWHSFMKHNR